MKQTLLNIDLSTDVVADAKRIIECAKEKASTAINIALLQRNWMLGKRLSEEVLETRRGEYGQRVICQLAKELTKAYGKGFGKSSLYSYVRFYKAYPEIFQSLIGKSQYLTWTHYTLLLNIDNEQERTWYTNEALREQWSIRTLRRNIGSQYYHRLLASHHSPEVKAEMIALTKHGTEEDKLEFIKNPVVAEFLGLSPNSDFRESELEQSIISHIQRFIMELGKGYAFVARQKHIATDMGDFYIDLVFYNYILKCFLLIDLKTTQISHQDVGQMDMYVRMYDKLVRADNDNPTIGLILCSETSADIARYSILNESKQVFQAKYLTYLPSKEELRREIERQKEIFKLQNPDTTEV